MKQVLSWLEIVMSPNALSWGQSKIKTGYMHENVKYTVIKHLTKKQNSIHISQTSNTILLSNNTYTFRELLPNRSKHFQSSYQTLLTLSGSYSQTLLHFFPDIKQYWHFQRVTGKQYYTLSQSLHQTVLIFSKGYLKIILHTFPEFVSNNNNIFKKLVARNTAHISRASIKQHWHFQRVTGKQYYKRFHISYNYQVILKILSYYQTILTYSEFTSNTFTFSILAIL